MILELGKQSSDPIYLPDVWEVGNFLKTASDRSIDTWYRSGTHPKINIEPAENGGLEDDFHFPGVYSQVPC